MTNDPANITAQDPVCGMSVEKATAQQSEYQSQTYYFCSLMCLKAFEDDPERYLKLHPHPQGTV